MSYSATVFKVMIASPSDVATERNIVREVLTEWNTVNADTRQIILLPVGWETHSVPAMGERPQALINKQILKGCDLLVGVFWTRIGTATGEFESGTVEEIEAHIKTEKPAMLYFSNAPVVPDSIDSEQYSRLNVFKKSCHQRGLCESYSDIVDFRDKFYRQLQLTLNQTDYFKTNGNSTDSGTISVLNLPKMVRLSREAQALLKECSTDTSGQILRLPHISGTVIQVGSKNMTNGNNDARSLALWEGALQELESEGLIAAANAKRNIFKMTREGYTTADQLSL